MKNKPAIDVSIIAPNYDKRRFLSAFIQSVIDSNVWPRELIIIDDGSVVDSLK